MRNYRSVEYKDGGYAIGEFNSNQYLIGLGYCYWPNGSFKIGEFDDGTANGICCGNNKSNNIFITAYDNDEYYGFTVISTEDATYFYQSENSTYYGYSFMIWKDGSWRYYYKDDNDPKTRFIEYHSSDKKLYMFYGEPGNNKDPIEFCKSIGEDVIDWDMAAPFSVFKYRLYSYSEFIPGNNCINPSNGVGPCIDYFSDEHETRIGSVNSNNKYEGILYTDQKNKVVVEQKTNGDTNGAYFEVDKDDFNYYYTTASNGTFGDVTIKMFMSDATIELNYYNYGDNHTCDCIQIDKDFNVTVFKEYDDETEKSDDKIEFNFEDEFNNNDSSNDDEVEDTEEEVEEVEEEEEEAEEETPRIKRKARASTSSGRSTGKPRSKTKNKGKDVDDFVDKFSDLFGK